MIDYRFRLFPQCIVSDFSSMQTLGSPFFRWEIWQYGGLVGFFTQEIISPGKIRNHIHIKIHKILHTVFCVCNDITAVVFSNIQCFGNKISQITVRSDLFPCQTPTIFQSLLRSLQWTADHRMYIQHLSSHHRSIFCDTRYNHLIHCFIVIISFVFCTTIK